jgi:hypothetical protein
MLPAAMRQVVALLALTSPTASNSYPPGTPTHDILPIWVTKTMHPMWACHPHKETHANRTSIVQRQVHYPQDPQHTENPV